jgi:hypothetical protein
MPQYRDRVNLAIAKGVAICSRSVAPEIIADLFVRHLASAPDWSEEEVADVQDYLQNWLACLDNDGRSPKTRE